jgi:glycosyltransferase involved in cell wall biosynthesis
VPVYAAVPAWDARTLGTMVGALRRLGPRPVLHVQFQAGAFDLGGTVHVLPTWLRAALPRAQVVTTFHDFLVPYLFPKAGPLRLAANRLLARTSHAAIFTDPADLASAGPTVRGRVVPIGSNMDPVTVPEPARAAARRRLGADDATFLVGYFGFLNQSKGVPVLVRAVRGLADAGRPVRLALLGAEAGASDPTDLAEGRVVRDLVVSLGLDERVTTTGYLEPAELSAALRACDALALPFLDGASPRRGTLMAAIVHGVPIVTTSPAGAGDLGLFRDGDGLLLVPPGDDRRLAEALTRLADHPTLRAELAVGAAGLAPHFAWPAIAEATEAVYASVLGHAKDAP